MQMKGWTVHAQSLRQPVWSARGGRDRPGGISEVDPETGRFRIEDMLPGQIQLTVRGKMANWIPGPTVTVDAGEAVTLKPLSACSFKSSA